LKRNPESRQRQLAIRSYAVTPLDDSRLFALIEWVQNTSTLKNEIFKLLKTEYGLSETAATKFQSEYHHKYYDNNTGCKKVGQTKWVQVWKETTERYSPVLYRWFNHNFAATEAWFEARQRFTRTAAVMSAVGYIFGLGDRHLENLLIDSSTGGIVHVDFNCLFWLGTRSKIPELVPFRLTPWMVDSLLGIRQDTKDHFEKL